MRKACYALRVFHEEDNATILAAQLAHTLVTYTMMPHGTDLLDVLTGIGGIVGLPGGSEGARQGSGKGPLNATD